MENKKITLKFAKEKKTNTKQILTKEIITKEMMLGDVITKYPQSASIMLKYGLHCIGCHVSAYENIHDGCLGHGMGEAEIDAMVKEINELIRKGD